MTRFRDAARLAVIGCLVTGFGSAGVAQDSTPGAAGEVSDLARMAAMTLDGSGLPADFIFVGETVLGADAVATGDLAADELTGAGFVSQYVSTYVNPNSNARITSYVSDWGSADAATAGFELIEDEAKTRPGGSLTDAEAGVGETPGETTSGTFDSDGTTLTLVDTTFRVDRYLVGVSYETADGTAPDPAIVGTMAGTLEGRATAALGDSGPDATNLQLASSSLDLSSLGVPVVQVGYLGQAEVEQLYGLRGSSLGQMTTSWNQAVALGDDAATPPYLALVVTAFPSDAEATATVEQFGDLSPVLANSAVVDGVEVSGAESVAAVQYTSPATGGDTADSIRVAVAVGSNVVVVDIQGASDLATAQATAIAYIEAQIGCAGGGGCDIPEAAV